jgi:hypothetical protein
MTGKRKAKKGKGVLDVLKKVYDVAKSTKILSSVGSMIPHPGAKAAAGVLGSLGLGKKKRKAPKKGKGILSGILGSLGLGKKKRAKKGGKSVAVVKKMSLA